MERTRQLKVTGIVRGSMQGRTRRWWSEAPDELRPKRAVVPLLGCAICLFLAFASGQPASAIESANTSESSKRYRLWRAVPVKDFAVLGEGTVRTVHWGIYAYRATSTGARSRPCIQEVLATFEGALSSGSSCGQLAPPSDWPNHTLSQVTINRKGVSIFGGTFATDLTKATVYLGPGPSVTRLTKLLSPAQARKAHLSQFRYLTFAIARSACIEGFSGFDKTGEKILDTIRFKCSGPPVEEVPSGR